MHLIYIDEVKYNPPTQPYYWLCGFAVNKEAIKAIDACVNQVAVNYFGSGKIAAKTEFHAAHIVQGKGIYKGHEINPRLSLYHSLIDCLCCHDGIKRIEVRIDPGKIVTNKDPADAAFMFFVEKSDSLMMEKQSIGVLIADEDREKISSNVGSLSAYRELRTNWAYGRKIEHLVDTIHHTKSHHSRLLQLADIYVYACQLQNRNNLNYVKKSIYNYANETNIYAPAKYKYWPTEDSPRYRMSNTGVDPLS